MNMPLPKNNSLIHTGFCNFINEEVLPFHTLEPTKFWQDLEQLISDLAPINRQLLTSRDVMQQQIDQWHLAQKGQPMDIQAYEDFLREIGYLVEEGDDFTITTDNVDDEIATLAGPQLVVPVKNARFALNAANARWGSLYDAFYGTDVIAKTTGLETNKGYNAARGEQVIAKAKAFLDDVFPLESGSHKDVSSYVVYYHHLLAFFDDGSQTGLKQPSQLVAVNGQRSDPEAVLLKNNGLHVEIHFDRNGQNGVKDKANINDIIIESALSAIIDCEDSVAAVDAEDKIDVYRNWLGLMQGTLEASFEKDGQTQTRRMNPDRCFTDLHNKEYRLHGRSLLLVRNVGHLMECDLMQDELGNFVPEGIMDAVVTALIGALDLQRNEGIRNSRTGSIYIVKPKMHGPDEVAFSCELFGRVEQMLGLPKNTIKIGIMDEERRTTLNLKECIRQAKSRVFFINTGFLDRTGDEIHTSMQAGPFLPKDQIKNQPWIQAYENRNVDIGLQCGLPGKAQIGKGMWAMPDEMAAMMEAKIAHPKAGANTAWVPSPTAATLHALHYHQINVFDVQERIKSRPKANLTDLLSIPIIPHNLTLSSEVIEREVENNVQGLLGYVVRWVEAGVGCSKVPDINNVGLMEDRATLRISSQHLANWLLHGICDKAQVDNVMQRMAVVVDEQNKNTEGYRPMMSHESKNTGSSSLAFKAAQDLIYKGVIQPNGYTEPLLHAYRVQMKETS
ncbi:malate synthase G [Marinomonas primoryensis]|uniref:Malate synthase G n=1 Tax=Marinomonas primoryensis TaxID=178399 RepID=A0A859CYF7_9GAMM|nr:malate synthase G [Marinomonas primoryensis]QKK81554.1 malate synthase G [Marinomonas primoryensis]